LWLETASSSGSNDDVLLQSLLRNPVPMPPNMGLEPTREYVQALRHSCPSAVGDLERLRLIALGVRQEFGILRRIAER
jgi:hypothetical protein